MPILKRALLFALELAILALGIWAAFTLAIFFDPSESWLPAIAFFGILILSVLAFVLFRSKSRKWKIALDVARFLRDRQLRRQDPLRTKIKRRLRRGLLWLPLCVAASTLFFLPATSQVIYSSRHLVSHYRFTVPRNWLILKPPSSNEVAWVYFSNVGAARCGLTPIWFNKSLPSGATFGFTPPSQGYEWYRPKTDTTGTTRQAFRLEKSR